METVCTTTTTIPGGEEKKWLATKPSGGRVMTLRIDDIVEKLKQMEEQESGEVWLHEDGYQKKEKHTGKARDAQRESAAEEADDVDDECEPGLTPRPGEGSQIDDPELARAKRRKQVLIEIAETEADYYRDLEILNNLYLQPLKKGKVLPDSELALIFSTLPTLLSVNKSLLDAVQARVDACHGLPDEEICIGDLFLQHSDYLKLYGTFCSRQAEALRAIRRNKSSNVTFQTFIQKAQEKPQSRKLELKSFLIKPVQRICQYPLLLQEVLKHTPETHKDHPNLELALEKLMAIAEHVNEATERAYSIAKIIELRHTIQGLHNLELINPKRSFVTEASFTELNKKRQVDKHLHLFLFTDCLLVCEPLKGAAAKMQHAAKVAASARASIRLQGPLYAFKQFFRLHEVVFKDVSDSCLPLLQMVAAGKGKPGKPGKERERAFTYDLWANSSSYRTLCATNLKEKAQWLELWTKVKREHDERKKQRSKIVYEAAKKKGMGDLGNGETACLDDFTPFGCAAPSVVAAPASSRPAGPSSPSPSAAASPMLSRVASPPCPGSPASSSSSSDCPSPSTSSSRFVPASPSATHSATRLSKLRDVIIKRKDIIKRSKAREDNQPDAATAEADAGAGADADADDTIPVLADEARDVVSVAMSCSRSAIVAVTSRNKESMVAPDPPPRPRAASKPTPPLPPPRRVLSSDCNDAPPSRPLVIPPLPALRQHQQQRLNAALAERPPLPPLPSHLKLRSASPELPRTGDSAEAEAEAKAEAAKPIMSPPPPVRPPRPVRLQTAAKQRSFYPTSRDQRQQEAAEQLARWNQFYDSAARRVRADGDDDDDSTCPGAGDDDSQATAAAMLLPVPPSGGVVPSPLSCPAALPSSTSGDADAGDDQSSST